MKIKELLIEKESITMWFRLSKKEDNETLATVISLLYTSNFNNHLYVDIDYPVKKNITLTITIDTIYSKDIIPNENKIIFQS